MNKLSNPGQLSGDALDELGHAISLLIQERYVWLFTHICRAMALSDLDTDPPRPLPERYFFSEEDQGKSSPPVPADHIMRLVQKSSSVFARSEDDQETYDYNFVREITRTGIRRTVLITIQSHLEYHGIERIMKQHGLPCEELFSFIRQARNIICHGNSIMDSPKIRPCSWRGIKIERNGEVLRLSDQIILDLINDAIEEMGKLYAEGGRAIDYVSLNLGFSVPYIKHYIADRQLL